MVERLNPELVRSSLDLMVLSVLADGPKYGYLIQQQVREASGGVSDAKAGTLYPLLHRLEADGLISSRWDQPTGRRRKWYQLTAAGRRRLKQQAQAWCEYVECVRRMLGPVLNAHA